MGASFKRTQKWDTLKCVLAFLVVWGHVCDFYAEEYPAFQSIFLLIYSFHMPLFIFISGLFSKRTVNEQRYDKLGGYLILYVLMKGINFLFEAIAYGEFDLRIFKEGSTPWYIFALFAFGLITIIVRNVKPAYVLTFSILFACFAGYDTSLGDKFVLMRILVFYPFYYAGYCLDAAKVVEFCSGKVKRIVSLVALVALCVSVFLLGEKAHWLRYLVTGRHHYGKIGGEMTSQFGFFLRLGYYVAVALICFCVICLIPNKTRLKALPAVGRNSLAIYALQFPLIHWLFDYFPLRDYFAKITSGHPGVIVFAVSLAITALLSLPILSKGITKIMNIPKKESVIS